MARMKDWCPMSRRTSAPRRPGQRLVEDGPAKARRTRARGTAPALPGRNPAENLELLSVIHPNDYRNLCGMLLWAIERQWSMMSTSEQRAAVEEMDRRREAAKDRPGSKL